MALRDISPKKKKREKIYKKTYLVLAINQIERARGGRGDSGRAVLKYARFPACTGGGTRRGEKRVKRENRKSLVETTLGII